MTVLYCPDRMELWGRRVLFLAGPDRFAPLWRAEAIDYLVPKIPDDVVICSPQRRDHNRLSPFTEEMKQEQMDWERDYLLAALPKRYPVYASTPGGVWLFWLPLRVVDTCGRNYGQRTGHELGLSAALAHFAGLQVVVGAEKGYHGLASTMHTYAWFGQGRGPQQVETSLQATCDAAVSMLML